MIGCALVAPAAALGLLRLIHPLAAAAFGSIGRLATRGIAAAFSRTSVAIAALMIAVSASIGVGVMIASFRAAVVTWLEGTLCADVYVSAPSLVGNRPDATLDPALVARLASARRASRARARREACWRPVRAARCRSSPSTWTPRGGRAGDSGRAGRTPSGVAAR